MRLAVLMTSHERRDSTLACLAAIHGQESGRAELDVILVDAGSRDGTATAVRSEFPDVTVLERGPELFWNGGMRVAWEYARQDQYDGYLWLNDDTHLDPTAIGSLLDTLEAVGGQAIVAGATRDPASGETTYSGVIRPDRRRPLAFRRVEPTSAPQRVETVNGNCVLVPFSVAQVVGILDPRFTHGMGDFDYGLRAGRAGVPVYLAPGTVGTCAPNETAPATRLREEVDRLRGPKGLPPSEWLVFARRWGGPLWPLYAASPYLRRVGRHLLTGRDR